MALSFAIDTSKGETPETVAQRRRTADALAARIFGRAPQNVGEGLNALGQAWIAASMRDEANDAQKAGQASAADAWKQFLMGGGDAPGTPTALPLAGATPFAPASTPTAPTVPAVPFAGATGGAPQSYFDAVKMAESSGNPNARSSSSSATGLYQFTTPTWNDLMRNRPDLGLTPDGRLDPQQQERAMRAFTDQNAGILTGAGIEASPANLYAAHFLGAGGARSVLGQPDNTPMAIAAGPEVVKANPFLANMTVGDFKAWTGRKVGGAAAPAQPQAPFPAPLPNQQPQIVDANESSPLDTAQYPVGPVGAPTDGAELPVNAQATQGQFPTAPQPKRSGYSLQQLMQLSANPWLNEGQRAVVNLMLKQQIQEQDPLRQLQIKKLETDLADGKSPESVREYEYAKKNGYDGSFQDWIASKRAGAGEFGLNPIWGTGPDGKPAIIQLGKSGKPILTPLPPGFEPGRDGQRIDLGTEWGILDPTTRQLVGRVPKDLRGAEREKGIGEAQGKAVASAPADIQSGQNALDILEKIRKDPYIDRGTGLSSIGNKIPGTGGYDFNNIVEQAKSGAFLQAIQQMRGLGSLSNAEGGAATAAITRMNVATSKEAFLDALADYEKIIKQGMARAQSRLNNPAATNPSGVSAPVTINGYKIEAVD